MRATPRVLSVILPYIAVGPAAVAIRRPELLEHNTTIYYYMKTKKVIKGTASDGVGECLMLHENYTKWIFPLEDAEELAERCDKAEELLDYKYKIIETHKLEAKEMIKKLQWFIAVIGQAQISCERLRTYEVFDNDAEK